MPENSCKSLPGGELKELSFIDSPKMSSYLLAFVVGEFDFIQAQTNNGVMVRVYTPPGKSSSGTFALDCAVKSLDAYDEFFGIHYPLPKLDMVGIPGKTKRCPRFYFVLERLWSAFSRLSYSYLFIVRICRGKMTDFVDFSFYNIDSCSLFWLMLIIVHYGRFFIN
jgi:hypothetical protein